MQNILGLPGRSCIAVFYFGAFSGAPCCSLISKFKFRTSSFSKLDALEFILKSRRMLYFYTCRYVSGTFTFVTICYLILKYDDAG